jgi:excisionase family DNA binding protein
VSRIMTIEIPDSMTREQVTEALQQQFGRSVPPRLPAPAPAVRTSSGRVPEAEPLLTPAEVSARFRVDCKTVSRWAKTGKIHCVRTLGGHRRFYASEVDALLRGEAWELPAEYRQSAA